MMAFEHSGRWRRIAKRIAGEGVCPLVVAVGWGLFIWYQKSSIGERDPVSGALTAFFAAFFFALSMQGQVLRIRKNVRDEDNANEFRQSFASIHEALGKLRADRFAQHQPDLISSDAAAAASHLVDVLRDRDDPFGSVALFEQSANAFDSKLYYPAAVSAAIAFETAARRVVEMKETRQSRPLGVSLMEFSDRVGMPDLGRRLRPLLQLRNGLVHPRVDTAAMSREEAFESMQAFVGGVVFLDDTLRTGPVATSFRP